MSLPHFFLEQQILAGLDQEVFPLRLSAEDVKHANVLRLKPGEHIAVIDAVNDYFECELVAVSREGCEARIAQHLDAPERPTVLLFQGLAKGEKMDSIIRQVTEIGVAGVVPLTCERSIVKLDEKKATKRLERWRSIAKSAAMQSGRTDIPEIKEPISVKDAAAMLSQATAVLVCWEEAPQTASFKRALRAGLQHFGMPAKDARVAVVVGPEGGLTAEEVSTFLACNPCASAVSLGPSILRTETAGVLAPFMALWELEGR